MQRHSGVAQNRQGSVIARATVTVRTLSGALATIYSDNGVTTTSNPVTANEDGEFWFYAANGRYTLTTSASGYSDDTQADVLLFDPADAGVVSVKDYGARGLGSLSASADATAANAASAAVSAAGGGRVTFPAGSWNFTFTAPPDGVTWDFVGPEVTRAQLGGTNSNVLFNSARLTYLAGPHATSQLNANGIRVIATGSDQIGAPYADQALQVTIEKKNWSESSGNPVAGEINGIAILTRNGRLTGDPTKTGGAAILADIGQTAGSGYTQAMECANSVFTKGTLAIERQINTQLNGIDDVTNTYIGLSLKSLVGTQTAALLVQNDTGSDWGEAIRVSTDGTRVFRVYTTGQVAWRQTATMTLEQESATNDLVFKNEAGTELGRFGQAHFIGKAPTARVVSATTYTVVHSTATSANCDADRLIAMANGASAATVTLPADAPIGFKCRFLQRDAAQITFSAASGATVRNRQSHTKTAGQYAIVSLEVAANAGGSAAIWYLSGDTAA